jgi:imidazoleglycerol-phosphate dehydratase
VAAADPAADTVRARLAPAGGEIRVDTGLSVLDHLLGLSARYGGFGLELAVAPGGAEAEAAAAGRALGEAARAELRRRGARGYASTVVPADEALAHVALDASDRPLLVSNVDLTEARVAGLATDVVARFLEEVAQGAGIALHVRLIHGEDTRHVLDAIFKALGIALAEAFSPRREERP